MRRPCRNGALLLNTCQALAQCRQTVIQPSRPRAQWQDRQRKCDLHMPILGGMWHRRYLSTSTDNTMVQSLLDSEIFRTCLEPAQSMLQIPQKNNGRQRESLCQGFQRKPQRRNRYSTPVSSTALLQRARNSRKCTQTRRSGLKKAHMGHRRRYHCRADHLSMVDGRLTASDTTSSFERFEMTCHVNGSCHKPWSVADGTVFGLKPCE